MYSWPLRSMWVKGGFQEPTASLNWFELDADWQCTLAGCVRQCSLEKQNLFLKFVYYEELVHGKLWRLRSPIICHPWAGVPEMPVVKILLQRQEKTYVPAQSVSQRKEFTHSPSFCSTQSLSGLDAHIMESNQSSLLHWFKC